MSAELNPSTEDLLVRVVEDALHQARAALDRNRSLDAVVWASAHLAALERAVLPVASSVLSDGETVVATVRRTTAWVEDALRTLERLQSGDALVSRIDGARLRRSVGTLLDEHGRAERLLLSRLTDTLRPDEQRALASSYRRALEHAPTRPHPHVPHSGALGRMAFRVDALRDRVLDVMDGRQVPAPRAPRDPVRPGRWGLWLLGQSRQDDGVG